MGLRSRNDNKPWEMIDIIREITDKCTQLIDNYWEMIDNFGEMIDNFSARQIEPAYLVGGSHFIIISAENPLSLHSQSKHPTLQSARFHPMKDSLRKCRKNVFFHAPLLFG